MAGSRIKGITVEIGGDTTKLQTALKGVNSGIKNTQSQLKDVEKLLKLDPGNTELLAQKQKLLSSAVSETKEKLATLKTAAEQANQALANGDISKEQYDALQWEIIETEEDLKKLEAQANQSATASENLKSAGDKVSSIGEKLLPASAAVTALGVAAVKTASESADAMNYMTMAGWKTSDMLDGIEGIMTIAGAVNTVTGAIKGIGAATSGISAVLKVFSGIGLVIGGAITAVKNFINMFQNGFSVVKDILMGVGIAL